LVAIDSAIAVLERQPAVASALPAQLEGLSPSYRFPMEGAGEWQDWTANPTLAQGQNFALERVALPMAWGCSYGDAAIKVAIIDDQFAGIDVDDIELNTGYKNLSPYPSGKHGTQIASVIGAHGDDETGIVGAMWRVTMEFYDWGADIADPNQPGKLINAEVAKTPDVIAAHYYAAGKSAGIVNVSRNLRWPVGNAVWTRNDSIMVA
jgi:hypothetical protein